MKLLKENVFIDIFIVFYSCFTIYFFLTFIIVLYKVLLSTTVFLKCSIIKVELDWTVTFRYLGICHNDMFRYLLDMNEHDFDKSAEAYVMN